MHNYNDTVRADGMPDPWQSGPDWSVLSHSNPEKWQLPLWNYFPWWARMWHGKTSSPGAMGIVVFMQ
jgi:hypothetical protein